MSHKDVKQTTRSRPWRTLLIGCCLLLLLGVVYWYSASPQPLSTAVPSTPKGANVPEVGGVALPQVATVIDSAQSLPVTTSTTEQLYPSVFRKVVKKQAAKTAYKETILDIPTVKPVDNAPVAVVAVPPVVEVEKKAVATVVAEPTEIKPFVQPVPVVVQPTDVKQISVQPTPVTVNAAPVIKRKTKNDEDVEIDLN